MRLRLPIALMRAVLAVCVLSIPPVIAGAETSKAMYVISMEDMGSEGRVPVSLDRNVVADVKIPDMGEKISGSDGKEPIMVLTSVSELKQGELVNIKLTGKEKEAGLAALGMVGYKGKIAGSVDLFSNVSEEKKRLPELDSPESSLLLDAEAALFMGVVTLGDEEPVTTVERQEKPSSMTVVEDSTTDAIAANDEKNNDAWYLSREDLKRQVNEAFDSVVGETEANYAYRLLGKVMVNNINNLGPNEYIISEEGSIIDMGGTQPAGQFILRGGTLDARGLNNKTVLGDRISGSRGALLTDKQQTLMYQNTQRSGYSVYGRDESGQMDFGAKIIIGSDAEASVPHVYFAGNHYASSDVSVKSGTLTIMENAVLGLDGKKGMVTVGTKNSHAMLVNDGVIKNDVIICAQSTLRGNGQYDASVTVEKGALLYIGNTSGDSHIMKLSTGYESSRGSESASVLGFFLDGMSANVESRDQGSHSLMSIGTLDWATGTEVLLEVGAGLVNNADSTFKLDLLVYDDSESEVEPSGELDSEQIILTGMESLLHAESIRVFWEDNTLVMTGDINVGEVIAHISPDSRHLANALWSSTSSVGNFARNSVAQMNGYTTGNSSFWVSGLGEFSSVSGDGGGYDYSGGGYAMGADHAFGKSFMAGLSLGQTFGTNKANDGGYASFDQRGMMGGLYARFLSEPTESSLFLLDAYAAYGSVENKGNMALFGDSGMMSRDKWNDDVFTMGLKASLHIRLDETSVIVPFVGIEYIHGAQGDIDMATDVGSRQFYDGRMQNWSVPVGLTYRKTIDLGAGQCLLPEITLAYVGDVARQSPSVKTQVLGQEVKTQGADPGRSALRASAGIGWVMDTQWSLGFSYTLETRSDMTNQGVNATINYSF